MVYQWNEAVHAHTHTQNSRSSIIQTNWDQGSSVNQMCIRILSSNTVIDLGNGL